MKILKTLSVILLSITIMQVNAQTGIPKGYAKGTIVLQDNSIVTGYIKDNLKKDASVSFINENNKKIKYSGNDISSVEIDGIKYAAIKGDFFKVICNGDLLFLQKASDASGTMTYNGTEAIYASGTPGKPGDYFIYTNKDQQLQLLSSKTIEAVTGSVFADYKPAIEKAKEVKGDIAQLSQAVLIYNKRNGK